jgi:predicted transcriptional regulator
MIQLNERARTEPWYHHDLAVRLGILQVLYSQRLRRPLKSTSESSISDILDLRGVFDPGPALSWLFDNGYVERNGSNFRITDHGAQYVLEQVPELKRLYEE